MPPLVRREHEVYASHGQFYVADAASGDDLSELWDGAALERHLGALEQTVAVGTVGYAFLPVVLEVWGTEPPVDEGWDHVAEASVRLRSGRLTLAAVNGAAEGFDPIEVEPGTYRVRAAGAGLDGATELDGGDRWRVQLWPAAHAEARVLHWWPAWNPAGARPARTTDLGRVLLGAEATDTRARMRWLSSRGTAHLFEDAGGVLWEHSHLRDAAGTPQLEELDRQEAERRYGNPARWGEAFAPAPGVRTAIRALVQTWRYSRGWRPAPDPAEPVVEGGRRILLGDTAMNRLATMRWIASEEGDGLYADEDGALWEWRSGPRAGARPRLSELSADEARTKYGTAG